MSVHLGETQRYVGESPGCEIDAASEGESALDLNGLTVALWVRVIDMPVALLTIADGDTRTQLAVDSTGQLQWLRGAELLWSDGSIQTGEGALWTHLTLTLTDQGTAALTLFSEYAMAELATHALTSRPAPADGGSAADLRVSAHTTLQLLVR